MVLIVSWNAGLFCCSINPLSFARFQSRTELIRAGSHGRWHTQKSLGKNTLVRDAIVPAYQEGFQAKSITGIAKRALPSVVSCPCKKHLER
jgi:hypothetical protein